MTNLSHATPYALILAVAAVGVLHTLVPDHWMPIVALGRSRGWSRGRTARAAAIAGLGHTLSTLAIGVVIWAVGAVFAARYAHGVNVAAALALLGFGGWVAWTGWRELAAGHGHGHEHFEHAHVHAHEGGPRHVHWHEHHREDWHVVEGGTAALHQHTHAEHGRTALLLVLGSSPMIEGLPAFFAASNYGAALLGLMSAVFAASTTATYVVGSTAALASAERISFGFLERYGEVLSGLTIAGVGVFALLTA